MEALVQRGSVHREWYANGSSSRRLEASWCRSLLAVEFSILELCPASLWWRGQGFGGTGVCHQRRRVLPTAHPCPLSLPPHFLCCHHSLSLHLKKVKLTHSLYPRPSRLSSALPSAPISSSAPNPPLTPLIALQQTDHSPHHRLTSCCILMPQNLPSTPHLPVSCTKPSMLPACHGPCVEVLA